MKYAMLIALVSVVHSADCSKQITELYNASKRLNDVKYCACLSKSEFDDFYDETKSVVKDSRKCLDLKTDADTLDAKLTRLKKFVK